MAKTKIFINVSAGLSGITIQRSENRGYKITPWENLTDEEKLTIAKLFSDAAIVYNSSVNTNNPTKMCKSCGRVLPISAFYPRFNTKKVNTGSYICKECLIAKSTSDIANRKKKDPEFLEKTREYGRKYFREHYISVKKKKELPEEQKVEKQVEKKVEEKQCRDCIYYKNCFTEEYANESNFANTCKKYKTD